MRILLDENVPFPIRSYFTGDDVTTVQELGWSGVSNGGLLKRAEGQFDVLILADKNLRYQQNLSGRRLALVELPTNRWPRVKLLASRIVAAARSAEPGDYIVVAEVD